MYGFIVSFAEFSTGPVSDFENESVRFLGLHWLLAGTNTD